MRSMLRQIRRAPGRIAASVLALALAVAAVGVLAIPAVSESTLHAAVGRDGLADIVVDIAPVDGDVVEIADALTGVAVAEGQAIAAVRLADGTHARLVGLDLDDSTMDRLQLAGGRLPTAPAEVVAAPHLAGVGDVVVADGRSYEVVGIGETLWWTGNDVLYAPVDEVVAVAGGINRLVVTAADDGEDSLRAIAAALRIELTSQGSTFTTMPAYLPDGSTPIDEDIEQITMLIGLLGVFAGGVALVLLASTTNTLITERTGEVAVMRALGGRRRPLQRRLRRIAVGIAGAALVVGLPLGVVISNVIARMVLEEFVGVTPGLAVDWWVVAGSAAGTLIGARLVAARAARRVVRVPLAEALRDREGRPFGARRLHHWVARAATGSPTSRLAQRSVVRHPGRTAAVVVQIAAAVGAAFLVPSLVTTVNAFNASTQDPWSWETVTFARDPGLPYRQSIDERSDGLESGIWTGGEIDGWEVDVFGLRPDTTLFDPQLRGAQSRWIEAGAREAVVSAGFADRTGLATGDEMTVALAVGQKRYRVVGLSADAARAVYLDRSVLAADLGAPGRADTIWAAPGTETPILGAPSVTTTAAESVAEEEAARDAIVMIFGAIGAIVTGVAGLAVLSTMTVNLHERRHELAALQAMGARRRRVRGLILRELAPATILGIAVGIGLGMLGTRGIIGSFESANAVEIGVVDAIGAIPAIAVGTLVAIVALAMLIERSVARRPIAVTLRGVA